MGKSRFVIYMNNKVNGAFYQVLNYYLNGIFSNDIPLVYRQYLRTLPSMYRLKKNNIPIYPFFRYKDMYSIDNKIVLYPFNATVNCRITANRKAKHIFITHGESNKKASIKPINRIYDHIIVAGQGGIDRFLEQGIFTNCDIKNKKIIKMGNTFIGESCYRYKETSGTILYAPTWEGSFVDENYSSITKDIKSFKLIAKYMTNHGYNKIIIQPHPNTGFKFKKYIMFLNNGIKYLIKQGFEVYIRDWESVYYQYFPLMFNSVKKIDRKKIEYVSIAFCDISAMEIQLLNYNIPTFIFKSKCSSYIPNKDFLKKYYDNILIDNNKCKFIIDKELIKRARNYYISYEEGINELTHYNDRFKWLSNYIDNI